MPELPEALAGIERAVGIPALAVSISMGRFIAASPLTSGPPEASLWAGRPPSRRIAALRGAARPAS
jgi:hypothetical protein